ncbi:DUF2590 family protein [Orbus wheelerorum]|uniref:DUF2590 family protein n=1 Tax=Orbus wheelerorum TaxID=3074111 RepID=UPI00370D8B34
MDKLYFDLLINGNDITLDNVNEPVITCDFISIGQDIKHAIIESGLAIKLIGERSPLIRTDIINQIELLAEQDRRIIPGTVNIAEETTERYLLTAKAYNYDELIAIGVTTA